MSIRFTILGSGSRGNCALVDTGETRILIDAGFSGKQIRERMATLQRVPEGLSAILLTHEHSDHIQGLKVLGGQLKIPIYCNRHTKDAVESTLKCSLNARIFETGAGFTLGDLEIETFAIPHDAMDPVGFMIRTQDGNIGFLTDLGHATRVVLDRMRQADLLVLEANHDLRLVQEDTKRPWSVKQRILSRHGHLSNDAAAEVIPQLNLERLKRIYLGHLSKDCNRPELAYKAVHRKLLEVGASQIGLFNTDQDQPCETLDLSSLHV